MKLKDFVSAVLQDIAAAVDASQKSNNTTTICPSHVEFDIMVTIAHYSGNDTVIVLSEESGHRLKFSIKFEEKEK